MLEQYAKYAAQLGYGPNAGEVMSRQMMDAALPFAGLGMGAMDAGVAGGMAFLQSELEKMDPKVREPLTSVTWMRDIVVKSGGGWVDFTSTFQVDYQISGPNNYGLMGGESNNIPIMQANLSKDIFRVSNWGNILKVSFIDMQKMQQAGRSLEDLLDKGIKLNWNKTLDIVTYRGPMVNQYGLLNNPNVPRIVAAMNAGATGTTWAVKTPMEILADINTLLVNTWAASEYDVTGMADHILIPPTQFAQISSVIVSAAGNVSLLTYLLNNNIGKTQGRNLNIFPSRWCIGAGQGGTDRMAGYVNDEDRVYLDVTVPISRVMTTPSVVEGGAYLTLYLGQIGVPKFLYFQPVQYTDGI
jgi:hypothetical protein